MFPPNKQEKKYAATISEETAFTTALPARTLM
jgi:hypothetical protein